MESMNGSQLAILLAGKMACNHDGMMDDRNVGQNASKPAVMNSCMKAIRSEYSASVEAGRGLYNFLAWVFSADGFLGCGFGCRKVPQLVAFFDFPGCGR
jgi:hypothetical protein